MRRLGLLFFFLLCFVSSSWATEFLVKQSGPKKFVIPASDQRNQASFTSHASLEDMVGTASGIDGSVTIDPRDIEGTMKAAVSVPISSLKSGIEMRDTHMRGPNWLDAEKYPTIEFTLTGLSGLSRTTNTVVEGTATGNFSLHGVTKSVTARIRLAYLEESDVTKARGKGDLLGVRANFSIRLSDFGIGTGGAASIIGTKVADELQCELAVIAQSGL